ncbi:MAG: aminotransferase class III-fold pyridoxal phosphate-dependent enzyme [Deltaproteobacteria bacterium]|nr:aminotransferase class III-fold pyridoxal phosphate-dependent enzyme [Deltaproteobacteria bacterium]
MSDYKSMTSEEIVATRKQHMLPSVNHWFRKPLHVAKASMQWVWDTEGKKYLDAFGGIVTISAGHNHPRIKKRMMKWIEEDRPQHTTVFFLSEPVAELAARVAKLTPPGLKRAFFTNSGSEANEMAILLARQYTRRTEIIALKHAYHGGTVGTMSLVAQHTWKWGGHAGQDRGVHRRADPGRRRLRDSAEGVLPAHPRDREEVRRHLYLG